ncbi:MAG TPA: hypothetical protein PKI19_03000 [Elusimicrobiales bacterium]|nr:hypothetical protein [Elusimicrobiales bacterium]
MGGILGGAFCILFLIGWFLLIVVLPVYAVIKLAMLIFGFKTGKRRREPVWNDEPLVAAADAEKARAAEAEEAAVKAAAEAMRAEAEAARVEALNLSKKEAVVSALKKQGRLDKLAMVYYVESAMREGGNAAAIAFALREKGWPENDIAEAFQGFQSFQSAR